MIQEHYSCREIPTDLLQYNSCWDLHPFLEKTEPVSQIATTIAQVGLVKPPLVTKQCSGYYEFITGWRSFNYLQWCSPQSSLWCRVLPEQTAPMSILTHLYLNYSSTRPINPIENAQFIAICKENLTSQDEFTDLFKRLGLKSNKTYLERIEKLLTLERTMQRAMMEGTLSENIARELLQLGVSDRQNIFTLFADLALGGGKQRRLLALIRDLTGRYGISCSALLEKPELSRVINHPEMNKPQKGQALLNHLQALLTPVLNTASDSFNRWRDRLQLPENQSVDHSLNFEKDEIRLSIRFRDREELEKALPLTQQLSGKM